MSRLRRFALGLAAFSFLGVAATLAILAHPESPVPREWNPFRPLVVTDPLTPITAWKLRWATRDPALCRATLAQIARVEILPPRQDSDQCHIQNRVAYSGTNSVEMPMLETSCGIALRVAMWEDHTLKPAAEAIMGSALAEIRQIGSYNCRRIKTSNGISNRMSTHATAEAVDITGFGFADGRMISLLEHWDADDQASVFLEEAKFGACNWFSTVLSPDYNVLHADHFHMQSVGWGLCR